MTSPPDSSDALCLVRALSEALLSFVTFPAAIVAEGGRVVSTNAGWEEVVKFHSATSSASEPGSELGRCLQGFAGVDVLVHQLLAGSPAGVIALLGPPVSSVPGALHRRGFIARWREVELPGLDRKFSVVVLEAPEVDVSPLVSVINAQRVSIDNLLIRQTLIEETERRRLGRALHDGITQELALIRTEITRVCRPSDVAMRLVRALDPVIESVRGLTFELSPPILEDLGIKPALHWLADHLGHRYDTRIAVADDGIDACLSPASRTIVFRAVRELAINAAKHARDAEIIISCATGPRTARFIVRDTGPGIDPSAFDPSLDRFGRFGLISVEQQIRGIGGSFEIVSSVGEGTRAVINVPLEPAGGDAHG